MQHPVERDQADRNRTACLLASYTTLLREPLTQFRVHTCCHAASRIPLRPRTRWSEGSRSRDARFLGRVQLDGECVQLRGKRVTQDQLPPSLVLRYLSLGVCCACTA